MGVVVYGIILMSAVYYDRKENRVPNKLCLFSTIAGGLLCLFSTGLAECVKMIGSMVMFFGLLFPFWIIGVLGAGDIKLLLTGCLYLREDFTLFLFCSGIAETVLCLFYMMKRRNLIRRLQIFRFYIHDCMNQGRILRYPFCYKTDSEDGGIRVTYGMMAGYISGLVVNLFQ